MQNFAFSLRLKMPVLSAVAVVALLLCAGVLVRGNLHAAWNMIHIPANTPSFSDTRGFTHAIDCVKSGQDPYRVSSFDPWHRLYNYPPVWLLPRHVGLTSRFSNLVGALFAIAAISAYLFLFNTRTLLSGLIVFLAITSRCVLLSVERGNTDQVVFFLLVFGLFFINRQRPTRRLTSDGILLIL